MKEHSKQRREFLFQSGTLLGLTIAGVGLSGFLTSCEQSQMISIPDFTFKLSDYPELAAVNGYKMITIPGKSDGPAIVMKTSTTEYTVLSSYCPHEGCIVTEPDMEGKAIWCDCHGSKFDLTGKVLKGPSKANLQVYSFTIDSSNNTMTIKFS